MTMRLKSALAALTFSLGCWSIIISAALGMPETRQEQLDLIVTAGTTAGDQS